MKTNQFLTKMKGVACLVGMIVVATSCSKPFIESFSDGLLNNGEANSSGDSCAFDLADMARVFAALPIGTGQVAEVFDATIGSSANGYDEEYTMRNLILEPGNGVGDSQTKAPTKSYDKPLREMLEDYLSGSAGTKALTKAGAEDVQAFLQGLSESDLQIYWPNSSDWDGETLPIITFDPGYGSEYNYGYKITEGPDGINVVDSVYVDEAVAMSTPVWVINSNDDAGYSPVELFTPDGISLRTGLPITPITESADNPQTKAGSRKLYMEEFTMLRHYDSWFRGGSEFFIKCGSVNGFTASTEAEMRLYSPSVSDFMVVVQRKYLGVPLQFNAIIMTDFTNQLENLAFLITEDDGGTQTSWKCSATVKVKSKSYGFEVDIPYNEKDDIVWRGQLSAGFFQEADTVSGRFGDVVISFALD